MKSVWLKSGILNTLEHGVTRGADAATTFVLLWSLPTEVFSHLAVAQASVAPLLLLFICPETVIYRDYAAWKLEGPDALASRIRALRLFGWSKFLFAVVLSLLIALGFGVGSYSERVWGFLWAFGWVLAPQVAGADREFLRLDLRLKELNAVSLLQKLSLLGGTALVAWLAPGRVDFLAATSLGSCIISGVFANFLGRQALQSQGASVAALAGKTGPAPVTILMDAFRQFSGWMHLFGVVSNWVQTMDVFFLGCFGASSRVVGLYATVLKLANLTQALPTALSNLLSLWIGRRLNQPESRAREVREVTRLSALLTLGNVLQSAAVFALAPWFFSLLSRGRWGVGEQAEMREWLGWILMANVVLTGNFFIGSWLTLRVPVRKLFFQLIAPWGVFSALGYASAVFWGGALWAARMNVAVGSCCTLLSIALFLKARKAPLNLVRLPS